MKETITFRPTMEPEKIGRIIKKLHYPNMNRFIDEAVREKIKREVANPEEARMEKLLWEVGEVIGKYKGTTFHRPSPALAREIDKIADPVIEGKVKGVEYKPGMFRNRHRKTDLPHGFLRKRR